MKDGIKEVKVKIGFKFVMKNRLGDPDRRFFKYMEGTLTNLENNESWFGKFNLYSNVPYGPVKVYK